MLRHRQGDDHALLDTKLVMQTVIYVCVAWHRFGVCGAPHRPVFAYPDGHHFPFLINSIALRSASFRVIPPQYSIIAARSS